MTAIENTEEAITALQREKVETKTYHLRCKVLPKGMKKVKAFLVQKIVKKLKAATVSKEEAESVVDTNEISKLETDLKTFKALDHVNLANFAFYSNILKDVYVQEKFSGLGIESLEVTRPESFEKISTAKCYQDAVKACKEELVTFLKKLFHEMPAPVKVVKEASSETQPREQKKLMTNKSFFMDSLNANDSDEEAGTSKGKRQRVAFSDDDDDFKGYALSDDESNNKKKKNRPGQLARRRMAEQSFGQSAKHLQSGGMSVKDREALRVQKSKQKRDRELRIKKEKEAKNEGSVKGKSLHPSWEAKIQSQNRINQAQYQGQRMKFGEEEATAVSAPKKEPVKIDPKLHPSWAAKLEQQNKLSQASFQGQKTKFED